jgi:predicted RNA-binding protein YlxR (DUF448 family)
VNRNRPPLNRRQKGYLLGELECILRAFKKKVLWRVFNKNEEKCEKDENNYITRGSVTVLSASYY